MQLGFLGALTLTFIVLKLLGELTWPWAGVLAPLFCSIAIFAASVVFLAYTDHKRLDRKVRRY